MNQDERLDYLIERLKGESPRFKNLVVDKSERHLLLRSLMNVWAPHSIDNAYLTVQADYLQEIVRKKGVVRLESIPTIAQEYGSSRPFADKISIWQGDITRLAVDTIVNAANSQLLGCFIPCHRCIDNAIHSAAGIELREECNIIMQHKRHRYGENYEEPVGRAEITRAYNLPAKRVIHTVGPIVTGRLNRNLRKQLKSCYTSVMDCAMRNEMLSVAFCCISTGEFHFPNDEAAKIAIEAVDESMEKQGRFFERIIFNVFQDIDLDCYKKYLLQ